MPFSADDLSIRDATTLVFSFGSAGADEQQQCPEFVKELSQKERVEILNFDTAFSSTEPARKIGQLNVTKHKIDLNDVQMQREINKAIAIALSAGKKVIVVENRAPALTEFVLNLAKDHVDIMGKQFELIGSYFQDIPVFKYNPEFIKKCSLTEANEKLVAAWGKWRNRFDSKLGDNQYNLFKTEELKSFRDQFKEIGILFRNLKSIQTQNLFSTTTAEPMVGLSEVEFKAMIEKCCVSKKTGLEKFGQLLKVGLVKQAMELVEHDKTLLKDKNAFGRTLAHVAVTDNNNDDPMAIRQLTELGVDFSEPDIHGYTPLQFTAWNAGPQVTAALVNTLGNARNSAGLTVDNIKKIIADAKGSKPENARVIEHWLDAAILKPKPSGR